MQINIQNISFFRTCVGDRICHLAKHNRIQRDKTSIPLSIRIRTLKINKLERIWKQ